MANIPLAIAPVAGTHVSGTAWTLADGAAVDEDVAGANDADFIQTAAAANGSMQWPLVGTMPANFGQPLKFNFWVRDRTTSLSDDSYVVALDILTADGLTVIAGGSALVASGVNPTFSHGPTTNYTTAGFGLGNGGILNGTKAQWDNCVVRLSYQYTVSMGNDGGRWECSAIQMSLDYSILGYDVGYTGGYGDLAPGAVGKDLDARWSVSLLVPKDFDAQWSVRQAASDDLDLRWDVQALVGGGTVSALLGLRWSTRTLAADSLDARWGIRELAGKSNDLRWATKALAGVSNDLRWSVRTRVADSLNTRWSVRSATGDNLTLRWEIVEATVPGGTVGKSLALKWRKFQNLEPAEPERYFKIGPKKARVIMRGNQ